MADERYSIHVLQRPFPEDFIAFYPYIKPEVLGQHIAWRSWLSRVILDGVPGVSDLMIAARDDESGEWVGVVWLSVAETSPELAHFGWFHVEPRCRSLGVGARIVDTCLETLEAMGVQMIMLPTQIENERAIGMYFRRGWRITIAHPQGDVWMVREPDGLYERTFTPDAARPITASEPRPSDFVALDYLLARPSAPIRLLPLGLVGSRRFVSFVHDWEGARHAVARQDERPMALAVAVEGEDGTQLDVFGLDRRAMVVALREVAEVATTPWADVGASDRARRAVFEELGFRMTGTRCETLARAQMELCRYAR